MVIDMTRISEIDNILPHVGVLGKQGYILHMHDDSYAFRITPDREEAVRILASSNIEITKIKIERNGNGLNDYRVFCRVAS